MDTIIAFALVIVAVLLFIQKPIKIQIEHKYPEVQNPILEQPTLTQDNEVQNLDNFITALQDIMGVSNADE